MSPDQKLFWVCNRDCCLNCSGLSAPPSPRGQVSLTCNCRDVVCTWQVGNFFNVAFHVEKKLAEMMKDLPSRSGYEH